MFDRIIALLEDLRQRFWIIPAIVATFGCVAALTLISMNRWLEPLFTHQLLSIEASNARGMMSLIAGTFIGLSASLFSMTLVAMTLASQQFGARLLGNFMRNRVNQFVLANFMGVATYCLVVYWSIKEGKMLFVPEAAVVVGFIWAFGCLGMMIYFLYHTAESIRVSTVLKDIGESIDLSAEWIYPSMLGQPCPEEALPLSEEREQRLSQDATSVRAKRRGYIQSIAGSQVIHLAKEHDLVITLLLCPGHFMSPGQEIARVHPATTELTEAICHGIDSSFILGKERSEAQDIDFIFQKLSDISNKALSPGINDPYTAVMGIDRMGVALLRLLPHIPPGRDRYDKDGALRVLTKGATTLSGLLDTCFEQMRAYAADDLKVLTHILHTLSSLADQVTTDLERESLREHIERTWYYIEKLDQKAWNLSPAKETYQEALQRLSWMDRDNPPPEG